MDTTSNYSLKQFIKHIWNVLLLKTWKRITRWEYLSMLFLLSIISVPLTLSIWMWQNLISLILYITVPVITGIFSIIFLIKRLHDLWKRWTHAFYWLIPLYNIFRIISICFKKWNTWENNYGINPLDNLPESNKFYRMFMVLRLLLFFLIYNIQFKPIMIRAEYNLGLENIELKNYTWAIQYFNKVIQLDPNSSHTFNNRGIAEYYL